MMTIIEQCFVDGIECVRTLEFETIDEYITWCEYHEAKESL